MTDLNSQLNYSASLHYQQQHQQYQNSLQKLQANLKEKAVMNNDPNLLINIPLDGNHDHNLTPAQAQAQAAANAAAQAQAAGGTPGAGGVPGPGGVPAPGIAWNSNFNNNGLFSDTLSPFFAPYGIDVSHFPLTNPPIFESSMMMNNHGQPRRRISISNGQIGQITTHSINDEDLYDSQPPPLPKQTSQDDSGLNHQQQLLYNQLNLDSSAGDSQVAPHLLGGAPPQQTPQHQQIPPQQQQHQQHHHPQHQQQQQIHQVPQHPNSVPPPLPQQQPTPNIKQELPYQSGGSGIPNHKLVYNNEVIFNPDAGPIPGTAAWKKARLLERNRIAASKCRQRKKAAHIQLKEDVEKYQSQINKLKSEKRILFESLVYLKNNGVGNGKELNKIFGKLNDITHPDKDDEDTKFDEDQDEDQDEE
ncbi:ATF/CREB activator 2 [Wickerhamomyces ciferrii]|uniref:ATF/CREB activator 2 n=1 Tax=Wickerhamomyces ciferrii (strain ATCC 14091 / BCRC 22168 / CBS 111 / JCM 3599 / NBRC 0793 / NRRL Y-1031 F-60-10) TaxID=1206466 RepID=K0KGZ9_WICCF|nr:ATF/CREB activator 2 [Wickerhamomyces ciferrii]CCH40664.1 ATF/CREB activator 2 [Wickerhamomyces ciferrii]